VPVRERRAVDDLLAGAVEVPRAVVAVADVAEEAGGADGEQLVPPLAEAGRRVVGQAAVAGLGGHRAPVEQGGLVADRVHRRRALQREVEDAAGHAVLGQRDAPAAVLAPVDVGGAAVDEGGRVVGAGGRQQAEVLGRPGDQVPDVAAAVGGDDVGVRVEVQLEHVVVGEPEAGPRGGPVGGGGHVEGVEALGDRVVVDGEVRLDGRVPAGGQGRRGGLEPDPGPGGGFVLEVDLALPVVEVVDRELGRRAVGVVGRQVDPGPGGGGQQADGGVPGGEGVEPATPLGEGVLAEVLGPAGERGLDLLGGPVGVGLEEQGGGARDVGGRHRGSGELALAGRVAKRAVAGGHGGVDVDTGGGDVGLEPGDGAVRVDDGPPGGEEGDPAVAVGGPDGDPLQRGRGFADRPPPVAVAGGADDRHALVDGPVGGRGQRAVDGARAAQRHREHVGVVLDGVLDGGEEGAERAAGVADAVGVDRRVGRDAAGAGRGGRDVGSMAVLVHRVAVLLDVVGALGDLAAVAEAAAQALVRVVDAAVDDRDPDAVAGDRRALVGALLVEAVGADGLHALVELELEPVVEVDVVHAGRPGEVDDRRVGDAPGGEAEGLVAGRVVQQSGGRGPRGVEDDRDGAVVRDQVAVEQVGDVEELLVELLGRVGGDVDERAVALALDGEHAVGRVRQQPVDVLELVPGERRGRDQRGVVGRGRAGVRLADVGPARRREHQPGDGEEQHGSGDLAHPTSASPAHGREGHPD
jgi:hypothetical protein